MKKQTDKEAETPEWKAAIKAYPGDPFLRMASAFLAGVRWERARRRREERRLAKFREDVKRAVQRAFMDTEADELKNKKGRTK